MAYVSTISVLSLEVDPSVILAVSSLILQPSLLIHVPELVKYIYTLLSLQLKDSAVYGPSRPSFARVIFLCRILFASRCKLDWDLLSSVSRVSPKAKFAFRLLKNFL